MNGRKNPNNSHNYRHEKHDEIELYQGNSKIIWLFMFRYGKYSLQQWNVLLAHFTSSRSSRLCQSMVCIFLESTYIALIFHISLCDTGWVCFTMLILPLVWNIAKWSNILLHNMPCICPDDMSILLGKNAINKFRWRWCNSCWFWL